MKLIVDQPDGTRLTFEGEASELAAIASKLAAQPSFSPQAGLIRPSFETASSPIRVARPMEPPPVFWHDANIRELWDLLWGEQAKLVKFLVERSGEAPYTEIGVYMGYDRQRLGAILSAIIRNARKAAKTPHAQFLKWKLSDTRGQIIYIDPLALEPLERILRSDSLG